MTDFLTQRDRSALMSRVRHHDTEPELRLRRELHALGLRFRLHRRDLPGTPDIVLPRYRAVVFVHGCFWHRHDGCRRATTPKSNVDMWLQKFAANVARDIRSQEALSAAGWRVYVVWECELSGRMTGETARHLSRQIRSVRPRARGG